MDEEISTQEIMSIIGETTFRVRYSETDQMRVAYHPNYIIWFELGRVAFLRQLGFTYSEMEEDGMHLPLVVVRKADERLLAEGESVHMVVGNDLRPTRLSGKYRPAFEAAAAKVEGATRV